MNTDKKIRKVMLSGKGIGNRYVCMRMSDGIINILTMEEISKQDEFRLIEDIPLDRWFEDVEKDSPQYLGMAMLRKDFLKINAANKKSEIAR
jgi:hypothetical protein